jgi:hypothetical protein
VVTLRRFHPHRGRITVCSPHRPNAIGPAARSRKELAMQAFARCALVAPLLVIAAGAAAQEKVTIRSLESPEVFEAQFNPTEITIDKPVPWRKHKSSEADAPTLEFTAAEPRTLHAELLFDTFEAGTSVQTDLAPLEGLASVDPTRKRPPLVLFQWGSAFPAFSGVIESIGVKYTLFLPDGTPVRATAAITVKEAASVRVKKGASASVIPCQTPSDCPLGHACFSGACAPTGP